MAGSASDYLENKLLGHVVGKASFTMPATPFLALVTVAVTDSDTGSTITEANYTGYTRLSCPGTNWGNASGGTITNSAAITFAGCTGGSSACVGWALLDASTAGNILLYGDFGSTLTVDTSHTPLSFAIGALTASAS